MDRNDIEEMAKDLIPLAEENNAGEALMTADYDEKWEFLWVFLKIYIISKMPERMENAKF